MKSPAGMPIAHCTVCGASNGRRVCCRAGYGLMQCACGAMYLWPALAADAVDHRIDGHPASFYALPAAMKVRWLQQSHARGRLLEVGCGDGHFLRAAREAGFEVCGIELDAGRASQLAHTMNVHIECSAIEHTQWPGNSCDVVYHCDLLSHFPEPLLALQQMTRLLRPDGVLFFEVGIVGGLADKWYDAVSDRSIPRHRWFFSEPALHRLLAQAGLRVERYKSFGLGPQALVYTGMSRVYQALRRLLRQPGNSSAPGGAAAPPKGLTDERPLLGAFNNFMRFSVGALFPKVGPLTALVVARRVGSGTSP
jgi:SAM-dependent methyltransferase